MNFIKSILKRLGDNYIAFFKSYLITNIVIIISTILTIIFLEKDIAVELFKYEIFFASLSFTVENFFENKKPKIIGFIIAYIIAFILGYLFNNYEERFANFFAFYLISLPSINLFHIIKKDEMSTYLHQLFSNLVSTTIINIVLNIGIFAVLGIITTLLIPDFDIELFLRVEIAILGFYTIPAYLYAFINKNSKITELANILLKYVIIPLTFIALLVVYLYLFKILITLNVPSNSVFAIVLLLFIETIITFALYKSLNISNKISNFIANNITYIFIPLYILQAYAMIIRVSIYGLTKSRYLGLMVLLVEAIILFLMKYKERKYLVYTFYVFIVASCISLLVPFINYEDASINYQVRVVDKMLKNKKFAELNPEEKEKLAAAYEYLKYEGALDKLSVEIKDNEIEIIEPYHRNYFYKSYDDEEKVIDVSKYSKMELFMSDKEGSKIRIKDFELDLKETIDKLIKDEEVGKLIYQLDANNDFYVTHLNVSGNGNLVEYVDIQGYILTK